MRPSKARRRLPSEVLRGRGASLLHWCGFCGRAEYRSPPAPSTQIGKTPPPSPMKARRVFAASTLELCPSHASVDPVGESMTEYLHCWVTHMHAPTQWVDPKPSFVVFADRIRPHVRKEEIREKSRVVEKKARLPIPPSLPRVLYKTTFYPPLCEFSPQPANQSTTTKQPAL